MNKQAQHPQKIMMFGALAAVGLATESIGISVLAMNVVPQGKLAIDSDGYTLHHGTASGGQQVYSLKSKLDLKAGGKSTITLALGNGGKMTVSTAEAEVAFAQLLPQLAAINQGAGTTATS
ncbi:MAG: hypothetical protein A3B13_01355 [Candidatus Liptonbacteria bacterium RIFCSPLOWO2_01_FULL_45_15]|uniref:Uncharacterized protein n=1 Tax=Candidatus Liptonbacteria bacterium RIFCSPLOWO2_01_FULL_45_15 TaxID=1798649 RepID=A0A1G2CE57_9BACT|nr:MAG: hypothetical protein A3B13_01355 [Candidatus Liptonbacteria bacterium RIFCSPLOWO2_01_FULL_45_15]